MKICKEHIYEILLLYCYFNSFMNANAPFWGGIGWIVSFGVIFCATVTLLLGNELKVKSLDFGILVLFFLGQFLGYIYTLFSEYNNNRFYLVLSWIFGYAVFVIVPSKTNLTKERFEKLLSIMIFIAIISSFYSIIFQFGADIFAFRGNGNWNISNVYVSFWGHRNQFAVVLLIGIFAEIYYILTNGIKLSNGLVVCFLGFNLICTLSRTAYVTVLVFVMIYIYLEGKHNKTQIAFLTVIMALGFIIYKKIPLVNNFVNVYMIRQKSGLTGRDTLWNYAFEFMNEKTYLFGRGLGIERSLSAFSDISGNNGFHNMYITYLVSGGAILIICLILLYLKVLVKMIKFSSKGNFYNWIICCMIAFWVYPFFEVSMLFNLNVASFSQTFFSLTIPLFFDRNTN